MENARARMRFLSIGLIGLTGLIFWTAPLARAQNNDTNAPPTTTITPSTSSSQVVAPNGPGAGPQQEDIDDIRPPFFYLHSWFWLWIALAAAAVIAVLILAWKGLTRSPFLSPKSAYELTLEKLEQARTMLREDDPVPYAVFVSETIRSYLVHRYQTPSTRRTTEEFLRLMEADTASPLAEHRDLLRNFLQSCDLVKFARYQPTQAELEEVQQRALTFVHATKPVPEATTKGRPA